MSTFSYVVWLLLPFLCDTGGPGEGGPPRTTAQTLSSGCQADGGREGKSPRLQRRKSDVSDLPGLNTLMITVYFFQRFDVLSTWVSLFLRLTLALREVPGTYLRPRAPG